MPEVPPYTTSGENKPRVAPASLAQKSVCGGKALGLEAVVSRARGSHGAPALPHREWWECATELGWGCIPGLGLHSWQPWLSLGSCGGSVSPVQGRARCPLPVLDMQLLLPSLASGTCLPKAGCAWPGRGLWCLAWELELGMIFLSAPSLLLPLALQAESRSPGGVCEPWCLSVVPSCVFAAQRVPCSVQWKEPG